MEYFLLKLVQASEMRPNFWDFFILCKSGRIRNYEQKFSNTAGIYLLKLNDRNARIRCEICSKLTIKTTERHNRRRSGVFTVNFEHISHLAIVFLLLTLNR